MSAPPSPRYSPITINLTADLRENLQQIADKRTATVSQVIREACIEVVQRNRETQHDAR